MNEIKRVCIKCDEEKCLSEFNLHIIGEYYKDIIVLIYLEFNTSNKCIKKKVQEIPLLIKQNYNLILDILNYEKINLIKSETHMIGNRKCHRCFICKYLREDNAFFENITMI